MFNVTDTGGAAVAASLTNIETVNLDVKVANGGLNMASVVGTKALNVTASANAQLTNVAPASAPTIGLTGSNVLTVGLTSLAGTTAAGTAETLSVKFDGAVTTPTTTAGLTLGATVAGVLETLNIESAGAVKNTVNLALTAGQVTGITKAVVTGAADLELRAAAAALTNVDLNASAHTGALTVRADFDTGVANSLNGLNAEKFAGVDGYVVTDTDGLGATAEAFGLYNIATGSSVRIADDFLGTPASLITVAGAAAGTAESVSIDLKTRATTATDVDLTGLTINGVETITINSVGAATSGAAIQNSITTLLADKVQTLALTGSSELSIGGLAAAASNASNITVDASALTAKLAFTTGVIADTTATGRTLTIKGGAADDTLDASGAVDAVKVAYTGGTGKDTFVLLAAANATTGQNDSITDFANGDVVKLGAAAATAGTFVNGLDTVNEITAAEQTTIEAAANAAAAAVIALEATTQAGATDNKALLFSYQGSQYIFLNESDTVANTADFIAGDALIKVTGLSSTTTFDAGTFLFVA